MVKVGSGLSWFRRGPDAVFGKTYMADGHYRERVILEREIDKNGGPALVFGIDLVG